MKKKLSLPGLMMALAVLASSCGGASETMEETTAASGSETAQTAVSETLRAPDLPEIDLGGREITIMTHGWGAYEPLNITDITAEELTGSSMDDAVFNRMTAVNEKFNCKLVVADYPKHTEGVTALNNSIAAGDDAYQAALVRSFNFNSLLTSGGLTDLETVPNMDLDAPWYDKGAREALGLLNRCYGTVSDLSMQNYYVIFCTYFNKQLMADYKLGSIYDTIRAGKWTLDEMLRLGKNVAADLDGNGVYDNKDSYAFTYIYDDYEGLLNASGARYGELDRDGKITITYSTEPVLNKIMHLFDVLSDETASFNVHVRSTTPAVDEVGMFMNRQSLFSLAGIYYAPQFRDMKDDFGIIPMCKYDEKQENYLSPMFSTVIPVLVVPKTNADLASTGAIIEEMSYLGRRDLYPALFDILLKGKISRDDDSNEMLDLIFNSTYYDVGAIYNFADVKTSMRKMYYTGDNGFASFFQSISGQVEESIRKTMDEIARVG